MSDERVIILFVVGIKINHKVLSVRTVSHFNSHNVLPLLINHVFRFHFTYILFYVSFLFSDKDQYVHTVRDINRSLVDRLW